MGVVRPWLPLLPCLAGVASAFSISPSKMAPDTNLSPPPRKRGRTEMALFQGKPGQKLSEVIQDAVAQATQNQKCKLSATSTGGFSGGGGASTGAFKDESTGIKYFYKSGGINAFDMLQAEFKGNEEMYDSHTIRVPKPIAIGTGDSNAFVVFEYLEMGGSRSGDSAARCGKELAQMHRKTSKNGKYGWDIDNTCGVTPQPNKWTASWADFYDEHRLGYMLKLCRHEGADFVNQDALRKKVHALLSEHEREHKLVPSLVHGDLWTGNVGASSDGAPCIFDPSTHYADREVDLAMSTLFGSLSPDFYDAYQAEWPLPPGYEKRKTIYNLYHILNHYVIFGGGYRSQAQRYMDQIMKF